MKTWSIRMALIGVIALVALASRPTTGMAIPTDNCDRRCTYADSCDKICIDHGVPITCGEWGVCQGLEPCFSQWVEQGTTAISAWQTFGWIIDEYYYCSHYTRYETVFQDVSECNRPDRYEYETVHDGDKSGTLPWLSCCDGNPWSCW